MVWDLGLGLQEFSYMLGTVRIQPPRTKHRQKILSVPNRDPLDHGPLSQAQHAPRGKENDVGDAGRQRHRLRGPGRSAVPRAAAHWRFQPVPAGNDASVNVSASVPA